MIYFCKRDISLLLEIHQVLFYEMILNPFQRHRTNPSSVLAFSNCDGERQPFQEPLPLDVANQMSLFFAHATPMLNALSDVVGRFVGGDNDQGGGVATSTTETLCVMAKVSETKPWFS